MDEPVWARCILCRAFRLKEELSPDSTCKRESTCRMIHAARKRADVAYATAKKSVTDKLK